MNFLDFIIFPPSDILMPMSCPDQVFGLRMRPLFPGTTSIVATVNLLYWIGRRRCRSPFDVNISSGGHSTTAKTPLFTQRAARGTGNRSFLPLRLILLQRCLLYPAFPPKFAALAFPNHPAPRLAVSPSAPSHGLVALVRIRRCSICSPATSRGAASPEIDIVRFHWTSINNFRAENRIFVIIEFSTGYGIVPQNSYSQDVQYYPFMSNNAHYYPKV